jgi:hypothetical protein
LTFDTEFTLNSFEAPAPTALAEQAKQSTEVDCKSDITVDNASQLNTSFMQNSDYHKQCGDSFCYLPSHLAPLNSFNQKYFISSHSLQPNHPGLEHQHQESSLQHFQYPPSLLAYPTPVSNQFQLQTSVLGLISPSSRVFLQLV